MNNRCCQLIQLEACLQRKPIRWFLLYFGGCFRSLVGFLMKKLKEKVAALFNSRGCLGCCAKPPLIISVDEPNKGLKIPGQEVKKAIVMEDFWSTSTCEMDNNSNFPSPRSGSSISTSTQTLDPNSSSGSMCQPSEFVNHGLLLWNQMRQQWTKGKESKTKAKKAQDAKLCFNTTYENLLGTNKPFPQPIPLPEMVEFLVDIWKEEGLYD